VILGEINPNANRYSQSTQDKLLWQYIECKSGEEEIMHPKTTVFPWNLLVPETAIAMTGKGFD
jgi:hypothetical protein